MPGLDVPNLSVLGPGAGQTSGLLIGLDPEYQARQLALRQATAFQGGLPTDGQGNTDWGAATNRLLQLGDYGNASKLAQLGYTQDAFKQLAGPDPFAGGGVPAPTQAAAGGSPAQGAGAQGGAPRPTVSKSANPDVIKFIATTAAGMGIDPSKALTVTAAEGLNGFDPNGSANSGDGNSSFGPFQLHYGNVAGGANRVAGLGDDFTAKTGLDARDPSTWKQQVVFALQNAKQNGWTAFHGAKAAGLGQWDGITRGDQAPAPTFAQGAVGSAVQAPAQQAASPQPAPSRPTQTAGAIGPNDPVPDSMYQSALRVVAAAQDKDPRDLDLPTQQAVTRAQELVDQYQRQGSGAAPVRTAQNGADDGPGPSGQHPFAPAPQAAPLQAPAAALQPAPAAPAAQPRMQTAFQTAIAADPSLGGLLSGQFVGDPAGAINYFRRQQALYGAAGVSAASDAFKARADNIEKTVERLDQQTPEQRNARDPAAVNYEAQRDVRKEQLRLAADTDPSRAVLAGDQARAAAQGKLDVESSPQAVRQAGQVAQATAAGTQQGQNSPEAVQAAAGKAAAVGEATRQGQYLGGLPAQYDKQAQAAQATNDNVDQMLTAAQGFRMGKGAPMLQSAAKSLQSTALAFGIKTPALDSSIASYEDFGKVAGVLSRNVAGSLSGPTGVQELNLLNSTLPSPEMSYDGLRGVASSLKGSADYQVAKQQAAAQWAAQHGNSLAGFEADFARNVTPTALWLHRLQTDQPDLFAHSVGQLRQTPQGKALLGKATQGLQYLTVHGGGD